MFRLLALLSLILFIPTAHAGLLAFENNDITLSFPVSELNIADAHVASDPMRAGLSVDTAASVDPGLQIVLCAEVSSESCVVLNWSTYPRTNVPSQGNSCLLLLSISLPHMFRLSVGTDFCAQVILIPERNIRFNINGGPLNDFILAG
ncbi:hypothetical protein NUW54_g8554 [Trametes sanguinea]|uniref:Uncharacterized protein n=1 Tax=Trametes sanguinea TaxID=158606 RepID=A0ACC1PFN4_9APHY|nr:hypothetical protein NUW54_g8554 [Trametes sanguinea]